MPPQQNSEGSLIALAGESRQQIAVRGLRQGCPAGDAGKHPLDVLGLMLVSPAVVGITYGLSQPAQYGRGSWQTLLPLLGGFASEFGADFYRLPRNRDFITLKDEPWQVPESYAFGTDSLVPLRAGETVGWQLEAVGTPIIGAVLNRFEPKVHGRSNQPYRGYYRRSHT